MDSVEKINQKAAELREAEARPAPVKEPPPAPARKVNQARNSVRVWWETQPFFWRYYSYRFGNRSSYSVSLISGTIAFLAMLPPGVALAAFLDNVTFRAFVLEHGLAILGSMGLVLAAFAGAGFFSYLRFQSWSARLPFPVTGWEGLTEGVVFDRTTWRTCTLYIDLSRVTPLDARQTTANAIELFSSRANRWFYDFEDDDHRRRPWKGADVRACGSVNARVAGELIRFLENEVCVIHERWRCVKGVRLEVSSHEVVVEPIAYGD